MTALVRLPRPDLIFFDVGDTLVRADPSWADVYLLACREFGLDVDRNELERALYTSTSSGGWSDEGPFEASASASYDRIKEFDALVMAELGYADLPEAFFRCVWRAFDRRDAWHVFPDVPLALDAVAAAGIRRAVISNWLWEAPELFHTLELAKHFEALVISARVGYQKPHPAIFRHALDVTGVPAQRTLHIGDSYRADVLGARTVGITPVLIDRGQASVQDPSRVHGSPSPREDVPVVRDLFGLLDLIGVDRPALATSP